MDLPSGIQRRRVRLAPCLGARTSSLDSESSLTHTATTTENTRSAKGQGRELHVHVMKLYWSGITSGCPGMSWSPNPNPIPGSLCSRVLFLVCVPWILFPVYSVAPFSSTVRWLHYEHYTSPVPLKIHCGNMA